MSTHHFGLSWPVPFRSASRFATKRSQILPWRNAWPTNQACDPALGGVSLGAWACQTRPLRLLLSAERFALEEPVELFPLAQNVVDDTRDLQCDEGAANLLGFLLFLTL
jgi:hypothetical protein